MQPQHKKILKSLTLELRHLLEGQYDTSGEWQAGDLEQRLNALGIWRDREPMPAEELSHLSLTDRGARKVVDAYLLLRDEAGVPRLEAVAEFVRETAYTWANRLLALRCMEARQLIDEVILQKDVYGGRSLEHHRLAQRQPELCSGEDDGLFTVFDQVFERQAEDLPILFDPRASGVALKPSVAALKKCLALLSGRESVRGQEPATDAVFEAHDAFGWAYQYWNTEEKDRVFEKVRTEKGAKIEGADIIPATQLYTEPYMVKFLVQNSLGALWMGMHPESKLFEPWEYYVRDADRAPVEARPIREVSMLDPAIGSGHFHLEAFDLFLDMYQEEQALCGSAPLREEDICASILNQNLFGIDIDERAIQIATAALWMKAKEKAPKLQPAALTTFHDHLVATNIRLPRGKDHLEEFLKKHPEDEPLRSALLTVFDGLENAHEIGSLLQIEEPVERELRKLKEQDEQAVARSDVQMKLFEEIAIQGTLPMGVENYDEWKTKTLTRLKEHFHAEAEAADLTVAFFGQTAGKGLLLLDLLSRRYDVVAANPPYMSFRNISQGLSSFLRRTYAKAPTDTYSAMLWQGLDLLSQGGQLAFVTQDGLILLPSLSELRVRILEHTQIDVVAHLGPRAFEDISGEKVSVALTVVRLGIPHRPPMWIRLVRVGDKADGLALATSHERYRIDNGLLQSEYLRTKNKQWLYFAPKRFIDILASGLTLSALALVRQGIITGDNDRYTRWWWETNAENSERWLPYFFGSDDIKWGASGYPLHSLDWRQDHAWRFIRPRDPELRFRDGVVFGRLGKEFRVARLPSNAMFDVNASAAVFLSRHFEQWVFAYLCSPVVIAVLKALNVSLTFLIDDIAGLPMPCDIPLQQRDFLAKEAEIIAGLRSALAQTKPFSACWDPNDCESKKMDQEAQGEEEAASYRRIDRLVQSILGLSDSEADVLRDLAALVVEEDEAGSPSDYVDDEEPQRQSSSFDDYISSVALCLLGHRWPKQIEAGESVPDWTDKDGVIPISEGTNEQTLLERVRDRIVTESPGDNVQSIENEFQEIMGESLAQWLMGSFFSRHISQFKKRPIAWQVQTGKFTVKRSPAFACVVYYHKLDGATFTAIQSQYIRPLRQRYETELRGIEAISSAARTAQQDSRRVELEQSVHELQSFDEALDHVAREGFGPESLVPHLRQFAIDDAVLTLKVRWLKRLNQSLLPKPLTTWLSQAKGTNLHSELPQWIEDALTHLHYHCAQVGPDSPKASEFKEADPTSADLAALICPYSEEMVAGSLRLACDVWWKPFKEAVIDPINESIKEANAEVKALDAQLQEEPPPQRAKEIELRKRELKASVKVWNKEKREKIEKAGKIRETIKAWGCPEAAEWERWLASQPLYDEVTSLDGQRHPPQTVQDFIAQERAYNPDINDGVRVNIAPLQQAGLLAADVLVSKDVDKAIADRAEWRADERRWVREGKLPKPGWWA